jgi:hypothetical protein
VAAIGCAAPIESDGGDLTEAATLPNAPFSGKLCLIGENSTRLSVGDALSVAQDAFPKPKRSFSITSVPPEFEEKYQVYGWENPGRSFAVLTQRGVVALALDIQEKVNDAFIADRVKSATNLYGTPSTEEAGDVKYWFWEDGSARAMICVAVDTRKNKTLSQAIGYTKLMDYMRMSPVSARIDSAKAFRTLSSSKS